MHIHKHTDTHTLTHRKKPSILVHSSDAMPAMAGVVREEIPGAEKTTQVPLRGGRNPDT